VLDQLIKAVSDWPVILQGAIGSALFWLVLLIGQKLSVTISAKYSESSKKRRRDFLLEQRLKYYYNSTNDNTARGTVFSALTYRAFRSFLRATIWLILGFLGGTFLSSLSVVGYLGALYYLFAALNTVTAVSLEDDAHQKVEEMTNELKKLDEV